MGVGVGLRRMAGGACADDPLFTGWSGGATGGLWSQKTSGHSGEKTPQKHLFPSSRGNGRRTAVRPSGECVRIGSPARRLVSRAHHLARAPPQTLLWAPLPQSRFPAAPTEHHLTRPRGISSQSALQAPGQRGCLRGKRQAGNRSGGGLVVGSTTCSQLLTV